MYGGMVEEDIKNAASDDAAFFVHPCFLNPFFRAITRPINIKRMLAPANSHLTVVSAIRTHASPAGCEGWMETSRTMKMFSSRSKNQAPSGITFSFRMLLFGAKPRWNSQEMSNPK